MGYSLIEQTNIYSWSDPKKVKKNVALLFVASFLFLFLFKPFTVNETELKYPFLFVCLLHALSPALITLSYFNILILVRSKKASRPALSSFAWVVLFLALFFMLGTASFLLRDVIYTNPDNWSVRYFYEELRNAYLAGSLFISYLVFAGSYLNSRSNQKNVIPVKIINHSSAQTSSDNVFIQAHVKIDDFKFDPDNLIFARAEGNYIELTLKTLGGFKKELKRISLKQFELQVAEYSFLFRCHRAYLVNIKQIDTVVGNSQGYVVSFMGTDDTIPVSRANLNVFDNLYQQQKVLN